MPQNLIPNGIATTRTSPPLNTRTQTGTFEEAFQSINGIKKNTAQDTTSKYANTTTTCMHPRTYAHAQTCTFPIHPQTHACMHKHIHTRPYTHTSRQTDLLTCSYSFIHTCIKTHTHTPHTDTFTNINTCTHMLSVPTREEQEQGNSAVHTPR